MSCSALTSPRLSLVSVALVALLASGCGGGGDDGAASAGGGSVPTQGITEDNARATAAATYLTVDALSGLGSVATNASLKSVSPSTGDQLGVTAALSYRASASGSPSLSRVAIDNGRLAARWLAKQSRAGTQAKAMASQSLACSEGGSVTMTVNDADNNGVPSAADSIELRFNGCAEDGGLANGAIQMTQLSSLTASNGASGSESATVSFDNLSITSDGVTASAHGGFAFRLDWSDSPETWKLSLTGQSLVVNDAAGRNELADFAFIETGRDSRFAMSIAATLRSTQGAYTVSTVSELAGDYYQDGPSSGVLRVAASNGSQLLMTAISPTIVQLDVDANGDGAYEKTEQLRWDALSAQRID